MARCWTARLVQEAVQPSFATVAAVEHPRLSLPRGTAVFHRSPRIFSHLAASTCLPRRLPRPALVLSRRARLLSSFILRYPPLPSSPASSTSYLAILALATCLGQSFISLSFLLPFRLRFAVVSPYFRANGGRHECLNIFPFSLFPSSSSSLPFYRHPTCVLVILFSFPTLAAHYAGGYASANRLHSSHVRGKIFFALALIAVTIRRAALA